MGKKVTEWKLGDRRQTGNTGILEEWNDGKEFGYLGIEELGDGTVEYWNDGILERWDDGIQEFRD